MNKEKFKESFGNPKLPKITMLIIAKTEKAIVDFINKG